MTRLRCVTMQRNETSRLEAWLNHHGYFAGFENLTVFDNGSTERETIRILRRAASVGTRVIWEHRAPSDALAREAHFENLTHQWTGGDTLAALLDPEDLLALFSPHGLSCRRDEIDHYLDGLYDAGARLWITAALAPDPSHHGFFHLAEIARPILAVPGNGTTASTGHGSARPTELLVVRATAVGGAPPQAVLVGFPALAYLGRALGTDPSLLPTAAGDPTPELLPLLLPARRGRKRVAATFDGARYLALNPDVAASSWPALKHFLLRGFAEGRLLE